MAKLVFPAIVAKSYAGTISQYRQYIQEMAYFFRKSPKAAVDLRNTIIGFANRLGLASTANGATVVVQNSAGAAAHNGTAVVTGAGVFTAVRLPATAAMVDTTVKIVIPISGTYVNGITLTVAAGVVTAGVLS